MSKHVVSLGALRGDPNATAPRASILPENNAAATQVTETFAYQSYYDTTLLEKAILTQASNNPIVQSTLIQQQLSGHAIGNHPDSQTPVAVVFEGNGRQSGSAVHIIPPGGIVRPTSGGRVGEDAFQSFSWGVPFGWLGGGTATIVVFQTKDSWANWLPQTQVLFHRFTAQIKAPADIPAAASITTGWPRNWPMRFPSLLTRRGSSAIYQGGAPQIAIRKPGRVEFNLRTVLGTNSTIKALFYHTTNFSDELAATPSPIPVTSVDIPISGTTPTSLPAGYTEYMGFLGPQILNGFGCDGKAGSAATLTAGVLFISEDPSLQGQYLDVARWGYL